MRLKQGRAVVGLMLAGLITSLMPIANAQTTANIEFWSPSDYTTAFTLSNKEDLSATVHLVATVANVPTTPLVEFEISSATDPGVTIDAARVSADTWEADLSLSSLSEGSYTLTANLFDSGQQVDQDTQTVTISKDDELPPPATNTVEMRYPENAGSWGLNAPKSKNINGLIDVTASEDTQQVRAFYTTSAPGSDPEWVPCGFAPVEENLTARVRCTLAAAATLSSVKGVAVVANNTPPPADPSALADGAGDAHRVTVYSQSARAIEITPEQVANATLDECKIFVATVTDQNNRPMAASNIDVHAVGPDDQVQFGSSGTTTSAFQAPDKGHVASRSALNCANDQAAGQQGDHNTPGADDTQHIESTAGTNNDGKFTFAVNSATKGGTFVEVWADEDDDDVQQPTSTSAGARIGWAEAPPDAQREMFIDPTTATGESGSCQRFVVLGKLSGSPMAGQNVDVHINGPDETVNFCLPTDDSGGTPPNAGTHTGNADDTTTRHIEGTLDSNGQFVFGVTAAGEGTTSIVAWADTLEDDIQGSDEASKSATVGWAISGERTISIQSSRSRQVKGRFVRISGRIDGATACEMSQTVELKSKRLRGGSFHTIGSTITDGEGDYTFRVRVRASRRYKAVAPGSDACDLARSRIITVKAT